MLYLLNFTICKLTQCYSCIWIFKILPILVFEWPLRSLINLQRVISLLLYFNFKVASFAFGIFKWFVHIWRIIIYFSHSDLLEIFPKIIKRHEKYAIVPYLFEANSVLLVLRYFIPFLIPIWPVSIKLPRAPRISQLQ